MNSVRIQARANRHILGGITNVSSGYETRSAAYRLCLLVTFSLFRLQFSSRQRYNLCSCVATQLVQQTTQASQAEHYAGTALFPSMILGSQDSLSAACSMTEVTGKTYKNLLEVGATQDLLRRGLNRIDLVVRGYRIFCSITWHHKR